MKRDTQPKTVNRRRIGTRLSTIWHKSKVSDLLMLLIASPVTLRQKERKKLISIIGKKVKRNIKQMQDS